MLQIRYKINDLSVHLKNLKTKVSRRKDIPDKRVEVKCYRKHKRRSVKPKVDALRKVTSLQSDQVRKKTTYIGNTKGYLTIDPAEVSRPACPLSLATLLPGSHGSHMICFTCPCKNLLTLFLHFHIWFSASAGPICSQRHDTSEEIIRKYELCNASTPQGR